MNAVGLIGWTAVYLLAFFYTYILVMGIYRAYLAGRIVKWGRLFWLCLPGIAIGWGMDVLANLLIAPFVFRDVPREWLVTSRLIRYRDDPHSGWRGQWAAALCDGLLDPFDPTGDHC